MDIKKIAGLAGASMLAFTTAACGNSGFDGTCQRVDSGLGIKFKTNEGKIYHASVRNEFDDTAYASKVRDNDYRTIPNATASITRSERMCHIVQNAEISSFRLVK